MTNLDRLYDVWLERAAAIRREAEIEHTLRQVKAARLGAARSRTCPEQAASSEAPCQTHLEYPRPLPHRFWP